MSQPRQFRRQQQQQLPCELTNELLAFVPKQFCCRTAFWSLSSVVHQLLARSKSFRRWHCDTVRAKEALVRLAKDAKQCDDYDSMAHAMKKTIKLGVGLNGEELGLFFEAHRNVCKFRESRWTHWMSVEKKAEEFEATEVAKENREKFETELRSIYTEMLELLEIFLAPNASNPPEYKVLYLKAKGNCYHGLVYVGSGADREGALVKAQQLYEEGFESSENMLAPEHPDRLDLILSMSKLCHSWLDQQSKARELLEQALVVAEGEQNKAGARYELGPIICAMRDCLATWESEQVGQGIAAHGGSAGQGDAGGQSGAKGGTA